MFWNNSNDAGEVITEASDEQLVIMNALLECLSAEDMESITEDADFVKDLISQEVVTERTIVRFDKKARLARAIKASVFAIARRRKDIKFKKLLTIWQIERTLERYLTKKYYSEALRLAKTSINKRPQVTGPGNKAAKLNRAISVAKSQIASAK